MPIKAIICGDDNKHDTLVLLSQVSISVSAQTIRLIYEFCLETAAEYEKRGKGFSHRHFVDWCKKRGIELKGGDIIFERYFHGENPNSKKKKK